MVVGRSTMFAMSSLPPLDLLKIVETGGARIPSIAAFQHAFCGLLMLADWIGSDERGFPFREPDDPPREACARIWAADALARIGLAVEQCRAAVQDAAVGDAAASGFPLNTVQRAVADLPSTHHRGSSSGPKLAQARPKRRCYTSSGCSKLGWWTGSTRAPHPQLSQPDSKSCRSLDEAPFPAAFGHALCWLFQAMCRPTTDTPTSFPASRSFGRTTREEVERQRRWAAEHPKRYMAGRSWSVRSTKLCSAASRYHTPISVPARSSATCSS